jgi:hypothetical protein
MTARPKPWQSSYEDAGFRRSAERREYGFGSLCPSPPLLRALEDDFQGHPVDEKTVILPDFGDWDEYPELVAFLKLHRLPRLNSGTHKKGYAITFRTAEAACAFRLLWPGQTVLASK